MPAPSRRLIELTSAESARLISETSILCLPLGSIEQHGPHLPLNTDIVVAEGLTRAIVAHWGEEFDLWQLPAVPVGLAREHDWAAGLAHHQGVNQGLVRTRGVFDVAAPVAEPIEQAAS